MNEFSAYSISISLSLNRIDQKIYKYLSWRHRSRPRWMSGPCFEFWQSTDCRTRTRAASAAVDRWRWPRLWWCRSATGVCRWLSDTFEPTRPVRSFSRSPSPRGTAFDLPSHRLSLDRQCSLSLSIAAHFRSRLPSPLPTCYLVSLRLCKSDDYH